MREYEQNILKIIELIEQAANSFYQQKIEAGNAELQKLIDILFDFIQNISNGREKGEDISAHEEELNKILLQITTSMQEKDYVGLADMLEYELKEYFEKYFKQ